ncbi:hypothetical protein [Spirochaeta africana]|uniref:hypothetical protein n=1 Tax=Spirochaeta africana TaxID=46355 RepID=UPI0003038356|nr:hypothetical protein [Spirochaeta africana]
MLLFAAALAHGDALEVSALLRGDMLILEAHGVSRDVVLQTLEDGLRSMLRFEVRVFEPGRWRMRETSSTTHTHTISRDPFRNAVYMDVPSGDRIDLTDAAWFDAFRRAAVPLAEVPAVGSELRVRAVWDPVLLIPGFRFLRLFRPGLRHTGPWTVLKIESQVEL